MSEIIYGDIKQYIDELAQSLGVAADHVYGLLVKQQIADGIVTIIAFIATGAVLVTVFYIAVKREDFRKSELTVTWFIGIASGMILFVTLLAGAVEITGAVKQLINPEYYAIKEIMDVFKGGE